MLNKDTNTATIDCGVYSRVGCTLFAPTGEFIHTYSRYRDAVRGAKRRGWIVE